MSHTDGLIGKELRNIKGESEGEGNPTPFGQGAGFPDGNGGQNRADTQQQQSGTEEENPGPVTDVTGQADEGLAVLPNRLLSQDVEPKCLRSVDGSVSPAPIQVVVRAMTAGRSAAVSCSAPYSE